MMCAFKPKKPIRSFRDLEVCQKMLECAVLFSTSIKPELVKLKYVSAGKVLAEISPGGCPDE